MSQTNQPYCHCPQGLPEGENRANFHLKRTFEATEKDVFTGGRLLGRYTPLPRPVQNVVARLSVRDKQSGMVLASREIARWQFEGQDERCFGLSYLQREGQEVEYIAQTDGAQVVSADGEVMHPTLHWPLDQTMPTFPAPEKTLDYIDVTDMRVDEKALFTTLKGAVNRIKPRIQSCEGNRHDAETWPSAVGLTLNPVNDPYTLIEKYKGEVSGIVIYDDQVETTLNLATAVAGDKGALVVSPALAEKLSSFGFPVLEDYRGKFKGLLEVYEYLYDQVLPGLSHRILASLAPSTGGCLREYIPAIKAAVVWLDPRTGNDEKYMLDDFVKSLYPGGFCMGWWAEEGSGIDAASIHGVPTIPSDFSVNLTVYGGTDRTIHVKPIPKKPELKNKIYVSLIMSDGDNLQYVEHRFKDLWDTPERGTFPLGWTISPATVDAMPGLLNWVYETATENDCFVTGPSGMGYTYPNHWRDKDALIDYLKRTDRYCQRAGIRVATLWAHSVGSATTQMVGELYAKYAPSLLGITGQCTGGGWRIYDGSLPNLELTGSYVSQMHQVKGCIEEGAKEYDGTKPVFLAVQAVPWDITVADLKEYAENLGPEYELVRPDIFFQLFREANGLPIDPIN